jgi:transcriptional regulator with XRE-family HTH domain
MRFGLLKKRLHGYLLRLVQNGDTTERGLARQTGISQPHIHNLLKGIRSMNPDIADAIMSKLGLTVLDLFDTAELAEALWARRADEETRVEIPVLDGRLGPALPWPAEVSLFERMPVACRMLPHVRNPVVVRLAADERMQGEFAAGDLALLDSSEVTRLALDPRSLFAVSTSRGGLVRWIRRGRAAIYLVSADCFDKPSEWERIAVAEDRLTALVRARVMLLPRRPAAYTRPPLPGMSRERVLPTGPN